MRAAWCDHLGPVSELTIRNVPVPEPGPGQVLVRVRAAAVNFPDVLVVGGGYQVRFDPPFVPGSEFAGEVEAVPDGCSWPRIGERVVGTVPTGAFAEVLAADAESLHALPDQLDYVAGAAYRVAYTTAYHSLVTIGEAQTGETVAVLGAAGGVGLATVDVAHRLGLRVIACASSPARLELCAEYGADETVDYSATSLKDRLKELTVRGVDVVVDPVGGPFSEAALRATRWGGRFVTVGFASGEIPRIPLNLVLLKGAQLRGFEMRSLGEFAPEAVVAGEEALRRLVAEGMRPHVSAVYPLDQVVRALEDVASRRALGKVVVEPG